MVGQQHQAAVARAFDDLEGSKNCRSGHRRNCLEMAMRMRDCGRLSMKRRRQQCRCLANLFAEIGEAGGDRAAIADLNRLECGRPAR